MILFRSWTLLSMTLINKQVVWSIQTEEKKMFLLVNTPKSSLLILHPMHKGHPFLRCRTQWSILCVLMYQSKNSKSYRHICTQPWCSHISLWLTKWLNGDKLILWKMNHCPLFIFVEIWKASWEDWPVALQGYKVCTTQACSFSLLQQRTVIV